MITTPAIAICQSIERRPDGTIDVRGITTICRASHNGEVFLSGARLWARVVVLDEPGAIIEFHIVIDRGPDIPMLPAATQTAIIKDAVDVVDLDFPLPNFDLRGDAGTGRIDVLLYTGSLCLGNAPLIVIGRPT